MSKEQENKDENSFGGFSLLKDDAEFMDSTGLETKEPVESKEVSPEAKTKEPKEPKKKEVKEPEVEVEETEEVEDTTVVEETDTQEVEQDGSFKPFLAHMANKGILDYEETDEDVEDSEEGLEKVVVKTVENGINKYKQSFPEDAQKFLEFVENGGNPADFHKYYYSDASFADFDITDEENQKYVIKEALKLEGYSDEEIEDEIKDTEDLGKLDKKAAVHLKKLQKVEKEQKETLLEAQKQYAKQQEEVRQKEWDAFQKGLYDKESIAGFKVNKKIKDEIWDYMTKPVDKKTGVTQYQRDMEEKGAEARYLYAWLLKTNFDISKLEKMVQTKEVSKLRSKLGNYTDTRSKIKSGTPDTKESTNNSFAGFRNFLGQ